MLAVSIASRLDGEEVLLAGEEYGIEWDEGRLFYTTNRETYERRKFLITIEEVS